MGVLVLTGEATMADVKAAKPRPDLVVSTLLEFSEKLEAVRATPVA